MAHLSECKDESDVGCRNDGYFVKTEFGSNDRLRSLFDQILLYFLKGVSINKDVIWGFPPKLSDGVEADLFTLFWVVRKIGNFELVSKNGLWGFVAEECGLDVTHLASLKLIYIKYLKELDQWLTHGGFKDMKVDDGSLDVLEKLDSLFHELKRCKYALPRVGFEPDKKGKSVVIESSDNGGTVELNEKSDLDVAKTEIGFLRINNAYENYKKFDGLAKSETWFSRITNVDEKDEKLGGFYEKSSEFKKMGVSMIKDDDKRVVLCPMNVPSVRTGINEHNDKTDNNNNSVILAKTIVNNVISSQQRKKDESLSLSKMLSWVANAARNPHDVMIGSIPNSSKWHKYKGNEVWKQVVLVKETLFAKRNVDSANKVYGSQV